MLMGAINQATTLLKNLFLQECNNNTYPSSPVATAKYLDKCIGISRKKQNRGNNNDKTGYNNNTTGELTTGANTQDIKPEDFEDKTVVGYPNYIYRTHT